MKNKQTLFRGIIAALAMGVIILDTKTAMLSAQVGIQLCIRTVIPSLFPFFILSGIINTSLLGQPFHLLRPLQKFCQIPKGSESLLLLGFLSGYPVGAQLIAQSCRSGKLSKETGVRMLGFCCNAGPAFLFGMVGPLFAQPSTVWLLWIIHIMSGLLVSRLLPGRQSDRCHIEMQQPVTFPQSVYSAAKTMVSVCGWVVTFRILLGFCDRWFFWFLPQELQVILSGILELTNGCVLLQQLPQAGMRFVLVSGMLAFGGLCVWMQTVSVTQGVGTGLYFPGKVLHASLAFTISYLVQPFIFDRNDRMQLPLIVLILFAGLSGFCVFLLTRKKVVAFRRKMLYNIGSSLSKGANYAVSEKNNPRLQLLPMEHRGG